MKNTIITEKKLTDWGACSVGKAWAVGVIGKGMSLDKMLPLFDRANWMLWLLGKTEELTKVQYVELAVICAKTALHIYEKKYPKDDRPRKAIEAAIRYCEDPSEENQKATAAYAAYAAAAADAAAAYAADAYAARKKHHKKMCALLLERIESWSDESQDGRERGK